MTFQHDLADKNVPNMFGVRSYDSDICCFEAMTLLPLHLLVNWQHFTVCVYLFQSPLCH